MSKYCHLSLDERFVIARLRESGRSNRAIANELGRSPSTIKRELARSSNADGRYRPETAEARYLARGAKSLVLDRLDDLASFVVERLHENWTPEQIAGWLKSGAEKLRAIRDLQPLTTPGQALAATAQEEVQTRLSAGQDAQDRNQGSQLDP